MHYSTNKNTYTVYTLIDITNTNVSTPKQSRLKYYQAQNYNTFLQTISLRTQPDNVEVKLLGNKDLKNFKFGKEYKKRKVWKITFECETNQVFKKDENKVYWLEQDFHNVPIHSGLKENIKNVNCVDTSDSDVRNTYFTFDQ